MKTQVCSQGRNAATSRGQFRAWLAHAALTLALSSAAAPVAASGIPVVDSASIVARALEHAEQIAKYLEQIAVMRQQLSTAQQQFEAITGSRNLGDILNNPALREALPPDLSEALRKAGPAYARIDAAVNRILNEEQLTGSYVVDRAAVDYRAEQLGLRSKALFEQVQAGITGRLHQLDQLQSQINLATDPKAIQELHARMLIEQANIQADQMRVDVLGRQIEVERMLVERQADALAQKSFSLDAIGAPVAGD